MKDIILKLRNRQPVKLWDKVNKIFIHIQLNKKDDRICWQRFHSLDRRNWREQNSYLRLKDVIQIINSLKRPVT